MSEASFAANNIAISFLIMNVMITIDQDWLTPGGLGGMIVPTWFPNSHEPKPQLAHPQASLNPSKDNQSPQNDSHWRAHVTCWMMNAIQK